MAEESSKEIATASNKDTDAFSLRVKPEFVLTERSSSLPPIVVASNNSSGDRGGQPPEHENGDTRNLSKKKNRRGQNKKRPRDVRQDDSEKICMALIRGDSCPYSGECRFSHDVKSFMATRMADIAEVEDGCPNYNIHGFCMYGAMCRVGGNHISKAGENLRKEPVAVSIVIEEDVTKQEEEEKKKIDIKPADGENKKKETKVYQLDVVNVLPKEIQVQLRKNKYRK
jgi:hypothetical protein